MLSTEKSKGAHQEKNKTKGWTHLTLFELEGLKELTEYLENLPPDQKCVPHDLTETDELIKDAKVTFVMIMHLILFIVLDSSEKIRISAQIYLV